MPRKELRPCIVLLVRRESADTVLSLPLLIDRVGFINGGPSPEFSGILVPTAHNYQFPYQEVTPCCALTNTSGTSIGSSVQYNAGSLFAALETGDTVRNTIENSPLWFELHPVLGGSNPRCSGAFTNACPDLASVEVRQEDCFVCGGWANGGSADLAALQPDADNNLTMVFTFTSFSDQPGVAYTSRRVDYPSSLMNGAGAYLAVSESGNSDGWHTNSATALDLTDPKNPGIWFSSTYQPTVQSPWIFQIGELGFAAPNQ